MSPLRRVGGAANDNNPLHVCVFEILGVEDHGHRVAKIRGWGRRRRSGRIGVGVACRWPFGRSEPVAVATASAAASTSVTRSSVSSVPAARRTRPNGTPDAAMSCSLSIPRPNPA
jgi:hypothetical protein